MIVHLTTRPAWQQAQQQGTFEAASLHTEGFIHFSRPAQMQQVANLFYRDVPDTILLWVDPAAVTAELKWEPVGETDFPHLYGSLNLDAVHKVTAYPPGPDGVFPPVEQ